LYILNKQLVTAWDDPDGPVHGCIELFISIDVGRERIVEDPDGKREVDGYIFEGSGWLSLQVLDDLNAHCANHHSSGGGNGRDDLASDKLDSEVVDLVYAIVSGP
jgi:hypothetical protein